MGFHRFCIRVGSAILTAALLAPTAAATVRAQDVDGFVPAGPGDLGEQLPATPLVFAAYAAVWIVLLVYIYGLWRRLDRVERDLQDVVRKLEARRP